MKNTYRLPIRLYGLLLLMGAMTLALATTATGRTPLADPLVLIQPTYDCATGAITFNTTGGDGSTITYNAPGITRSSLTSNTGTIEQGLLNDPKPITIQATQSGQTVSYRFNFKGYCSVPFLRGVLDEAILVNQPKSIDVAFASYNFFYLPISASGLPPGMQLVQGNRGSGYYVLKVEGTPTTAGTYPVTVTATIPEFPDDSFSKSFIITVTSTTTNADREVLVELYNSTNGPGWTNKTNWLQGDSPCGWFGIVCDGVGQVKTISLPDNKLAGTLPASLGNLSRLQVLNLTNNQLSGSIPATLGNLARVDYLDLSRNQLSGSIPTTLGNLLNAFILYLYDNQLSGPIPASLGNLPNIEFLLLHNNQLTGSIPASFGNLTNIRNLRIDRNQLSGCFPVELSILCGKGVYIDMSSNPGLPGGGDFASFCSNRTGACSTTTGNLTLIAPTYDCGTGAITFKTTGGDGSTITYTAPGIIRSSLTSNTGTVEQGLRNDPKPITIQATQSGQTTSYLFDLKAFCTGDDIRLYGVDTTFFAGGFDYKVGEGTYDPSNPIDRWSKTVTGLPPDLYFNYRLQDDRKTYTLHIFGDKDNKAGSFPITITIVNPRYPNQPITNSFILTFRKYGPEPGNLALAAPTYNCATGAFKFNITMGNGTLVEYQAPGITGWTTNPNQFVDKDSRTANDVQPFTLMARQSGNVVTYTWDLKQACGRARVAAEEAGTTLSLQLLGNPVHESVQVLIKGAEGQSVQLRLTDVRGRLLESRAIEQAGTEEVQQFKLDPSAGPGMLFLQATKQQQTRTVKIIRQ